MKVHRPPWADKSARYRAEAAARYDAKRRTDVRSLYSSAAWKKLRARVLREEPVCAQIVLGLSCGKATTDVDHRRPHRGDARLFFDRRNLWAMCHGCHSRKTRQGL